MKDTIPYEIAVELKGIPWPDFYPAYYLSHKHPDAQDICKEGDSVYREGRIWPTEIKDEMYGAPLVSEVLNYFRKEHSIHIAVNTTGTSWFTWLTSVSTGETLYPKALEIGTSYSESFEDALLLGIIKAIQRIKLTLLEPRKVNIEQIAPQGTKAREYLNEAIKKEIEKNTSNE